MSHFRAIPSVFSLIAMACASPAMVSAATKPVSAPQGAPAAPASSPATDPAARAAADPAAVGSNLLINPGFERGREGWTSMGGQNWGAFDIVDAPVRSGLHSARLPVHATLASTERAKVFGVVQEIRRDTMPGDFPDTLSGWYRVNDWKRPAVGTDVYLQVVVIIWGDPRAAKLMGSAQAVTNYQIRFYLAGLEKPAFTLGNAKLEFVGRGEPVEDQWVHFEIPVKAKFQETWGVVPADYEFIRVLFEARWDNRPQGAEVDADVTYDDLFFGYGKAP